MAINRIDYLDDAEVRLRPDMLLKAPPEAPENWAAQPPWFDETGWAMPTGGYLLCTDSKRILVDAGTGPTIPDDITEQLDLPVEKQHSGRLLQSLNAAGFTPDDITDVVLTHLHSDHVGWIAPWGVPQFTRARHYCHRADLDWITSLAHVGPATAGVKQRTRAVADLLIACDVAETEIGDGVTLRLMAGHTPGNCVVDVDTDDGPILLLGDTAHHPALLVETGWTDHADEDHYAAVRAREDIATESERTGAVGWGSHFPDRRGGRISHSANGGRRWTPVDHFPTDGER